MAVSSNGPQNDVDSLFNSSFWRNSNQSVFIEDRKLMLGSADTKAIDQEEENDSKASVDEALDGLLRSSQNMSLAELKPLPPFSGFSANLNINGISGQHYQTISQQLPEENNNYACYAEQNIVSSSTCTNGNLNEKLSLFDAQKINFSDCIEADPITNEIRFKDTDTHVKTEAGEYDISSIEDIAAIIGSAIADTTVPARQPEVDELTTCSRDSWMDLDAWIDNACGDQQKVELSSQDTISEFLISNNNNNILMPNNNTTTDYNQSHFSYNDKANQNSSLHSLLSQNNMPLLQYRLENGPPIKQENSSASNYVSEIISASNSPSNVVSTTDNLLLTVNERFMSQYGVHIIKENGNSDILDQNYPRNSSGVSSSSSSKRAKRPPKKHCTPSTTVFSSEHSLGMLGKEKPVHRCNVCNRGFLNKSNIKVHLRTHTGEKPFRCDTCAKAFRQKAHLLKHQQIHRRIGRD